MTGPVDDPVGPAADAAGPEAAVAQVVVTRWRCPVCDYVFDEAVGDGYLGYPAGTAWADVPDDFTCPDCGVRDKIDFEPVQ